MSRLATSDSVRLISLWVSNAIEADYTNRGAFPGLRSASAEKRSGTWLVFTVPLTFAHDVLEDAEARKTQLGGGRGLYQAYRALAQKLARELDDAEGVLPLPEPSQWKAEIEALTCHAAGARLRNCDGEALIVVEGYGIHAVIDDRGDYRNPRTARRVARRWGYTCRKSGEGEAFFIPAGDLYADDRSITHLRLVRSA